MAPVILLTTTVRVILIGQLFTSKFRHFFAQLFNLPYFPVFFFPKCVKFNEHVFFLLLENFTNSDRTPPYIDISNCFQSSEIMEKTLSYKNEPKKRHSLCVIYEYHVKDWGHRHTIDDHFRSRI